jgi:hypothetical protein
MGPALLPAPLSPAPFPTEWWVALSLPDVMRGRHDAHRAAASAMGTGGASHRDARRIGPDWLRGWPSRNHCIVSNSSVRSSLATAADRLPSASMTAPTSGPVRRSEVIPKDRFFPPGGSNGRFHVSPSGRSPCGPRSLPASFQRSCSALSWSCNLFRAFLPHLPAHLEPADGLAPLAASAVR